MGKDGYPLHRWYFRQPQTHPYDGMRSTKHKNGEPFRIHARSGRQEYDRPNVILLEYVSGTTTRISNGQKITDNITADAGEYDRVNKTITLTDNVHVDSSNGDKIRTDELVIKL